MASSIGEMAVIAHRFITSPQTSPQAFCNVIKLKNGAENRLLVAMASSIGEMAVIAHRFIISPQTSPQAFCNVIKLGTFCRTVVWPCLPPLMMYQYIRGKDEDMYSIDVLYYKSGSSETKAFWDGSRVRGSGHWRLMQDLETIRAFCNVIKLGTFCRTVVWPCLPPLMMYQYIRGKDEDMYSIDVLYYKSGSSETKAFWDGSRVRGSGHWRLMQDLETIRAAANSE
ncbi:unnamed protein product [Durusdinium trenchii]|uniref:Uncharacterized protein n=1 Tax=Durusdinium trenchii TaxID=1381693 RepID=A0ABP0PAX9_9DINO